MSHGIEGQRVVDASALPDMPSARIEAVVAIFAERASDLIRGRPNWRRRTIGDIQTAAVYCSDSAYTKCGRTCSHNSRSDRIIISGGMRLPKFSSARMPSIPRSSCNSRSRSVTRSGLPTTTLSRSTCS